MSNTPNALPEELRKKFDHVADEKLQEFENASKDIEDLKTTVSELESLAEGITEAAKKTELSKQEIDDVFNQLGAIDKNLPNVVKQEYVQMALEEFKKTFPVELHNEAFFSDLSVVVEENANNVMSIMRKNFEAGEIGEALKKIAFANEDIRSYTDYIECIKKHFSVQEALEPLSHLTNTIAETKNNLKNLRRSYEQLKHHRNVKVQKKNRRSSTKRR